MSDTPDNVTLAVLWEKTDNVQKLLQTQIDDGKEDHDRIRVNEIQIVRLDQRLKNTTGILGTLQIIGIGIVTWLGLKG